MKYVNIRGPTVVRDAASTYIVDKRNSGIRHNGALMWTTVYVEGIISYINGRPWMAAKLAKMYYIRSVCPSRPITSWSDVGSKWI